MTFQLPQQRHNSILQMGDNTYYMWSMECAKAIGIKLMPNVHTLNLIYLFTFVKYSGGFGYIF